MERNVLVTGAMSRDDSRPQRFAKTWLGPSLATLVGIGSTVELAAMPIPAPGAQLLGPTLIQQSPKPQGGAEQPARAPRPPAADESKPDAFLELQEALTATRGRVEELSKAAEAVAATRQQQQELAALRQENQQLRAELEAAQAERSELETTKQAAEAQAAELTKTVEQATAKAREMDQQVVAVRSQSEQRIAAADSARTEAEALLSELRDSLQRAEQDKARGGADLARVQGELATAKEQVAAAGQEHAQIEQRAAALRYERDDLRPRLADATARLERSEAAKVQLESEVADLREAARTAATHTRQLIEALAAIGLAAGPLATDAALLAESGKPSVGEQGDGGPRAAVAVVAAPSQGPEPGSTDADLQRTETASATRPGEVEGAHLDQRGVLGGVPAVLTLADLPPGERQHVQGLLADLHSRLDERGLMTTVPGELLFTAGSDEVRLGAYNTLAKVAELISMYADRQVLIIGHSDAEGPAADNQQLSERRAELVKQMLVNRFKLAADRLATEGLGEARPIASNDTPRGRRANRRVEVLILN
jgi:outer membrane protein OmpA-like peptidoglycan-associated protein/predicted nuclease with TOPRIM domain